MKRLFLDTIGKPATLELLAEECSELAQVALKYARILREENPTPVTEDKALKHLTEEIADVQILVRELTGPVVSSEDVEAMAQVKLDRTKERYTKAGMLYDEDPAKFFNSWLRAKGLPERF